MSAHFSGRRRTFMPSFAKSRRTGHHVGDFLERETSEYCEVKKSGKILDSISEVSAKNA